VELAASQVQKGTLFCKKVHFPGMKKQLANLFMDAEKCNPVRNGL